MSLDKFLTALVPLDVEPGSESFALLALRRPTHSKALFALRQRVGS